MRLRLLYCHRGSLLLRQQSTFRIVARLPTRYASNVSNLKKQSPFQRYGKSDPIERRESWNAMSPECQTAWETLGWDEESWTHGNPCPGTEYILWDQMSAEQRVAAEHLGYTRELWEAEDESEESLFHLKQGLIPSEFILGLTIALVGGWNLYAMDKKKKKDTN
mmetsp:Transcript_3833/g.5347  ORF Transcript_3833/g.5347 Transcript_3833/m.5347 type:complete len:164 (-) Transcript_3833:187-678(-)